MLLTSKQMALVEAYEKKELSDEERKELMELDAFCVEMYGEHIVPEKSDSLN